MKGHAGHPENERADELANRGLDAMLAEGGRLVMPVGGPEGQTLVTCERDDKGTLHHVGVTSTFTWDRRAEVAAAVRAGQRRRVQQDATRAREPHGLRWPACAPRRTSTT